MKKQWLTLGLGMIAVVSLLWLLPADQASAATRLRPSAAIAALDDAEAQGLLHMREEEKLARDVYLALYAKWGKTVFSKIIESEQRHMDAIKRLLDKYRLADPAAGLGPGEFADPVFGFFYAQLVERGTQSLAAAFEVGVTIEEMDISDLESRLLETDNPDIRRVYTNLLSASRQHLKTFQAQLDRLQ